MASRIEQAACLTKGKFI